jgi:TRAP-type C4-dicarboxylate transport system substrate-binding protein
MAALAGPGVARAATRRLRLGHNNNTRSITHAGALAFAAAVAERSGHRLVVDIFPDASIGDEKQMMKAVADGTLDASVNMVGTTNDYAREICLVELPYLFPDAPTARRAMDGALGAHCAALLAPKAIVVVGWGEYGIRHVTANKPIRVPSDMAGLKLRVQVSEPTLRAFLAIGAAAETLPFTLLPEALRIGRFEAQENPFGIVVPAGFEAVQSHMSLTAHCYTPSLFVVSGDIMDDMGPGDRDILRAAGAAGAAAMRAFSDRMDKDGPGLLRARGMTIVGDVDRHAFRRATEGADEPLARMFGADALARVRRLASA